MLLKLLCNGDIVNFIKNNEPLVREVSERLSRLKASGFVSEFSKMDECFKNLVI